MSEQTETVETVEQTATPTQDEIRTEYEAKWETFRAALMQLAQEHQLAGVFCTGIYVKADEKGRVQAVPTYSSGVMPTIGSPAFLYSMRDSIVGLTKTSAEQAIEFTLKQMEAASQPQATQAPAEA